MGRAQRMVGYFMQDFVQGYMERIMQYDQERISGKVAATTADDYYDYQSRYGGGGGEQLWRRNDVVNIPEKHAPVVEKVDPKLASVVEMLKNLKPKANQNDSFIINYARALTSSLTRNNNDANTVDQNIPTLILMGIQKFLQRQSHADMAKSIRSLNETKNRETDEADDVEGRNFPTNGPYVQNTLPNLNRRIYGQGAPPPGLPSFNELPPADCEFLIYFNFLKIKR